MKLQKGFTLMELIIVLVGVLGVGGWIANIIKVMGMNFDPLTAEVVLRSIGIFFFPLGMIMGYL